MYNEKVGERELMPLNFLGIGMEGSARTVRFTTMLGQGRSHEPRRRILVRNK